MADRKISDLTALTTPATGDLIPIVDISEAAAADKNKSITVGELLRGAPDGTAAAPGIAFESDGGNGMFLGGTDILAFSTGGSQAVTIDASQRVGINNSSPGNYYEQADNLVIGSTSNNGITIVSGATSNGRIHFADGTTGNEAFRGFLVYDHNADAMQLGTAGDTAIHIDSSQRVGINTTSPGSDYLLDCVGAARFNGGNGYVSFGDNGYIRTDASNELRLQGGTGGITFWKSGLSSESARFTDGGRFLIGTSGARGNYYGGTGIYYPRIQNEATSLATSMISNVTNSNDTYGAYLILGKSRGSSANSYTIVQSGDSLGNIDFHGADGTHLEHAARIGCEVDNTPGNNDMPGRLVFHTCPDGSTGTQERARINSKGAFKATTDGTYIGSAQSYHELVQSNANVSTFFYRHKGTGASAYGGDIQFSGGSPDDNTRYFLNCSDATAVRFRIYSDGDVVNHDNSYGSISDQKLKQDIVDAGSQWDDIKDLRVRKFKFKADVAAYGDNAKTLIGLVAQEAELISPGLVKNNPDQDEDHNDLGTVTKTINYSVLYMKAIKALQEAMERIETLEAKVAALEAN